MLDFGLAKLTEERQGDKGTRGQGDKETREQRENSLLPLSPCLPLSLPGTVLGTPHYMSPEQARGWEVDSRTDIFSLGVVLYEMAAGRKPFEGPATSNVIAAILESEPPPLRQIAGEAAAELEQVVMRA
ncbi:MAG: protein kinase domain-containing protein, partial [Blastocatellia bacterium]